MLRFGVIVALLLSVSANAQIVLGPPRPLTAHVRTGPVPAYVRHPESAGGDVGYDDPRRILESTAPSSGPLTIAYVASAVDARANGTARIRLRDIVPDHHRAAAH